jgi:hypothetical protein
MYDPAKGIADILVEENVGVLGSLTGWNISLGRFPDQPDTSILVNQTGGYSPFPHLLLNFPSVQVLVRGSKGGYQDARAKIDEVADILLGIDAGLINPNQDNPPKGDWWQGITQMGDVSLVGYDENHRPLFTANFNIIVEPQSGTNRDAI